MLSPWRRGRAQTHREPSLKIRIFSNHTLYWNNTIETTNKSKESLEVISLMLY